MRRTKPEFIAAPVFARERSHRRGVLLAMAFLLFLSTSPVYGHHFAEPLTAALLGRDHLFSLCVVALYEMLAPVHDVFHLLLVVGVVYAVVDRMRAMRRLSAALRLLRTVRPAPASVVGRAAAAVGVDHRVVRVVHGSALPAVTAGLWRPVIFVAQEVVQRLPRDELAAVIAHEDAHRRRRDPLRLTAWRFLACTLFFLPVLRRLADDMADEAEVTADDDAVVRSQVQPLALASALLSVARRFSGRMEHTVAATAFHRSEILGRRVRRLTGEDVPVGTHLTRRSVSAAAIALSAVWLSGLAVAHPLAAATSAHDGGTARPHEGARHCSHEHRWAITHLFCRGLSHQGSSTTMPGQSATAPCPHAGS